MKRSNFGNFEEREKGFEPSTLALASRLGVVPADTDALQDSHSLKRSGMLSLSADSNGSQFSQPIARFSAPNVDGHVDALLENATSQVNELAHRRGRLLTVRQVAERLSVSRATVYSLVSSGALSHLRVSNEIRVWNHALESYLFAQGLKTR